MQPKLQRQRGSGLAVRTAWIVLCLTVLASPFWTSRSLSVAETRTVTANESLEAGAMWRWIFGSDYRNLWTTPIEVEVLDLKQEAGGLRPLFRVGGVVTYGLAFAGADGKSYTFRSLIKDHRQNLHEDMREYFVGDIFQDQLAASHPAAPLIAGPLAKAAGVLQSMPKLVVLPDDPALGEFRELFAGRVGTFEEFPTPASDTYPGFQGATEIISTHDLVTQWLASPDVRIDARALLRARLLDFFIGDWDRHANNWRWAKLPGKTGWQPIPEDRDVAFADYKGLLLTIARPFQPKFIRFRDKYPTRTGLTIQGWQVLRWLLAELEKSTWIDIATDLQARLTDAVIDEAVNRMPPPYYELRGEEMARNLKARRERLPEFAESVYRFMNAEVDIQGTDQSDRFELRDLGDGGVEVLVALKTGGDPYFQRRLSPAETGSLRLYLRSGNNTLVCQGPVGRKIKIDVIGSRTQDALEGCETSRIRFTETEEAERRKIPPVRPTPDPLLKLTLPTENIPPQSDRPRDWRYRIVPIYTVGLSSERGLVVGGGVTMDRYAFGKSPYGQRHSGRGAYSTGLNTFELAYQGLFQLWNPKMLFSLEASISGFELARFYGFGNDTSDDDLGISDFFKTDQLQHHVLPSLRYSILPQLIFFAGPRLTYSTTEDDDTLLNRLGPYGVGNFGLLALQGGFDFDNRDGTKLYGPGFRFRVQGSAFPEVWDVEETFGTVEGDVAGYISLSRRFLMALRVGGKHTFGRFPFQEAAYIGGKTTVRGLNQNRFAGDSSVFGNAELRYTLGRASAFLFRAEYGLFIFGDVGRVFFDEDDDSDKWHPSGGGGISAATLERSLLWSFTVARSEERTAFFFRANFSF